MTALSAVPQPAVVPAQPSPPRLRLQSVGLRGSVLDGAWWPRSADPVAELPGLVLAIDALQGPVTRLMLHAAAWSARPRRLMVAGRVVRLGYFASQPADLLIALCGRNGARVDLLTVPPSTPRDIADAAMAQAATVGNLVHAQDIVAGVTAQRRSTPSAPPDTWESEGGQLAPDSASSDRSDE